MELLRTLIAIFRRPAKAGADRETGYEAEVLFAGWVDIPPLFREGQEHAPPVDEPQHLASH